VSIICCTYFSIVDFVLFLFISALPKFIDHDVVIMNSILFMYIMSMVMVTSPCSVSILFGRLLSEMSITFSEVFRVVFSFRLSRLACMMSSFVIGQFGIIPFSTYFMKSSIAGCMIMFV